VRTVRFSQIDTEGFPAVALVRPDGYVAWASDDPDPAARAAAAERAVRLWCGPR
jgi:hypothetical protein